MPSFTAVNCYKAVAQHVAVGMGAASFWRGAWYLLDDHLFPDDAAKSASASLGLGAAGMYASQGLMARAERLAEKLEQGTSPRVSSGNLAHRSPARTPIRLAAARFGALYTVALSCVLVWRGTWVGWDVVYERLHPESPAATDPGHATKSGLLSHVTALSLLLGTGVFASVLAPPAAVSVIRDFAVKAGQTYTGPAQRVTRRLFGGGSTPRGSVSRSMSTSNSSKLRRNGK